jgi:hypothetical protein
MEKQLSEKLPRVEVVDALRGSLQKNLLMIVQKKIFAV